MRFEHPYSVDVSLEGIEVTNSPLKLQIEKQENFGSCLFEIANPVSAHIDNKPAENGALISVNSVRFFK